MNSYLFTTSIKFNPTQLQTHNYFYPNIHPFQNTAAPILKYIRTN